MIHRYRAHGLLIDSDTALPLIPAAADAAAPTDLRLRRGEDRPVPAADPDGQLLARLAAPDGRAFYSIATDGARVRLRYPELCEFVADPRLREVTVHLAPGRDPGVVSVLAAGTLLAVHLRLRGELVLHASAVRVGAVAVAFVGASGMGKSTMATLLCAADHALLSDDVLRVERWPGGASVHPGSTETRLRDGARPLARTGRPTADGRLAVAQATHVGDPVPLAACVVPQPQRDRADVQLYRLPGPQALMLLARFPRVLGWREPGALAREFQQLGDLVERVGVYLAQVPWGPPFPPELAPQLIAGLDLSWGGVAQR